MSAIFDFLFDMLLLLFHDVRILRWVIGLGIIAVIGISGGFESWGGCIAAGVIALGLFLREYFAHKNGTTNS